jgi:hypothetical protein
MPVIAVLSGKVELSRLGGTLEASQPVKVLKLIVGVYMRDKIKRRLSQKRYGESPKGKLNRIKCKSTPAGIASKIKYRENHKVQLYLRSSKSNIKRKFNLSAKEVDNLFLLKDGLCWCCGKTETSKNRTGGIKKLSLDHNHSTGIARGLLCHRCNTVLGFLEKNGEIEVQLKEYLLRYNSGEKFSCIVK